MRKEVLFAIVAGVSIGLFFAFGVWQISKVIKRNAPISLKRETPTPKKNDSLILDNLKAFDVITANPFKIAGVTIPNSDLIASTSEKDYYTKSLEDGSFEIEVNLPSGLTELKISNLSTDKNDFKIPVVYSTEVEELATSYVGTITDISKGTIQLKSGSGEILQASTEDNTTYVNLLKKITEIKETDLAIGDYVAILGIINGNKVLHAKRILITSPITENKIEAEKITIEKLSKTTINDITLPKTWNGPNIKELEVGQEIIIVGTRENEKYTLRSIFTTVE